ncbi:MAG: hypothetical protein R3293_12310 [Candidatus Promineifilaceae bacterium]|nr:hypothetical protein [Candidatus Promineifilaceae bacterium]
MSQKTLSRRQFLRLSALSSSALVLAACGGSALNPDPTAEPPASSADSSSSAPTAQPAASSGSNQGQVIVGDVLDHALTSDEWPGAFGFVTFRLHEGVYNGEPIYFIRTDASETAFAEENKLVFVPLLNAGRDVAASLYSFGGDQPPVLAASPGDEESFTSLFHIKNVTVNDDSLTLDSAEAVEMAAANGGVAIAETNIFVNYPVVKWSGGELAVDTEKDSYLGTGQLLEAVNTSDMTVKFKLHECFPGSRYIVTDTSIAAMAPMMSIPASPPNAELMNTGATDEIWVFGNGLEGSGVMGFQPAIFDNQAGQPAWSPFWNHFTVTWAEGADVKVLKTSAEIRELIESGDLELFNGVPDSHPTGFVVNCPVPVLAENTFSA